MKTLHVELAFDPAEAAKQAGFSQRVQTQDLTYALARGVESGQIEDSTGAQVGHWWTTNSRAPELGDKQ